MTALPLMVDQHGAAGKHSGVEYSQSIATVRIGYTTLGGFLSPAYAVYDSGQLIGTVISPAGRPAFGPTAPTVLLNRAY